MPLTDLVFKVINEYEICRSFERSYLKENDLKQDNPNLFLNHIALINHAPLLYVLASCFTFLPPDEVPVGMSHRVLWKFVYSFAFHLWIFDYQMKFRVNIDWEDEKKTDIDYIRVYVYNENQGLKTFLLNHKISRAPWKLWYMIYRLQ